VVALDGEITMKKTLLGLTLTSAVALASANAADMYVAPPAGPGGYKDAPYVASWAGFYAGVNGGYGWSAENSKVDATATGLFLICPNGHPPGCIGTFVGDTGSKSFGTSGGFGGGQIGYNWQPVSGGYKDSPVLSHFVFGIEADIQGAGIGGSGPVSILFGTASAKGTNDLDWFGTVRGRLGYAMDATLFYFTGGLAVGGVKDTLSVTPTGGSTTTVSKSDTETGFVLGGGVEHLFSPRWSAKIEYQYIDLGDDKLSIAVAPAKFTAAAATLDAEHTYHTVRIGLNYHISPAYVPLK
jgi:outer membrane immunogenic protein